MEHALRLLALLAAAPAAALGTALPPDLAGLRLAADDAPALSGAGALAARSSWQDLIRFSDAPNPDYPSIPPKPWTDADRRTVLDYYGWVVQNQPGLWARAVEGGPLTMYRVARHPRGSAWATERGVVFTDDGLVGAAAGQVRYTWAFHVVLHETVHLADGSYTLSSRPEWRSAVEAAVRGYRAQAAARPLLSEYHAMNKLFYQAATKTGTLSARYDAVLADCADAAARGVSDGDVSLNCGQSRMMSTLQRSIRRSISPEERQRGYAEAAAELCRARELDPSLAPQAAPLERQLEGLLNPKAPAA